jgi:hypothetical protein
MLKGIIGSGLIDEPPSSPYGALGMSFIFNATEGMPPPRRSLAFATFTGASASAYWDFGDNSGMQQMASPSHTYAGAGAYSVCRYGDLTGPTAWTYSITWGGLSGIKVGLPHLITITFNYPAATLGSVDLAGCSALTSLSMPMPYSGSGITSLVLTGCSSLATLMIAHSSLVSVPDLSPCPLLATVDLSYCSLSSASVDYVLVYLASKSVSNGTATLIWNGVPSSAGLAARTILLGRGWTVAVDS